MPSLSRLRTYWLFLITCLFATALKGSEVYYLKKVVITDSEAKAAAIPDSDGANQKVVVHDVAFLESPGFAAKVEPFFGQPIDSKLVNGLIAAITEYARGHDRLITKVILPNQQSVVAGTVRLAVVVGRYNQLIIRGNRWFSTQYLQYQLGIKPGDEIRQSLLEEGLQWANANPFRQMKVFINELQTDPAKADLIVTVQDAKPLKLVASYSNSGLPLLGRNQYSAGFQLGDLWHLDHQLSYQFVTTDSVRLFQGHSLQYVAPLPWHHYLQMTGSYVRVQPTLFEVINQKGESAGASLRYRIPFGGGDRSGEVFFGGDFNQSNNNLQYGGSDISATKIHIFQGVAGVSYVRRDLQGAWVFGTSANLSPGNVDSHNTDTAFQPALTHTGRFGARARYAMASVSVQRWLKLPRGWDFYARGSAQLASSNLPADEQLAIGGVNTVRGFNPNILSGEDGYILNNDLQSPVWKHTLPLLPKNNNELNARFGIFYDAARVYYHTHFPRVNNKFQQIGWDDDSLRPIASTGVSVRMNVGVNFNLTFDYGVPVTSRKAPLDGRGQGHIKVTLAY